MQIKKVEKDKLKIRYARKEDVPFIHKLLHKSWVDTYVNEKFGITKELIDKRLAYDPEDIKKRQEELVEGPGYCVAEIDNVIVGLVRTKKHEDGSGELKSIYLHPDYIGMGIGAELMKTALDWLKDCSKVLVKCASYNERAISFYKKFGFENPKEVESYPLNENVALPQVVLEKVNKKF